MFTISRRDVYSVGLDDRRYCAAKNVHVAMKALVALWNKLSTAAREGVWIETRR